MIDPETFKIAGTSRSPGQTTAPMWATVSAIAKRLEACSSTLVGSDDSDGYPDILEQATQVRSQLMITPGYAQFDPRESGAFLTQVKSHDCAPRRIAAYFHGAMHNELSGRAAVRVRPARRSN